MRVEEREGEGEIPCPAHTLCWDVSSSETFPGALFALRCEVQMGWGYRGALWWDGECVCPSCKSGCGVQLGVHCVLTPRCRTNCIWHAGSHQQLPVVAPRVAARGLCGALAECVGPSRARCVRGAGAVSACTRMYVQM